MHRKVAGSNPRLHWGGIEPHVEVSLSKILNPRIAPDVQLTPCVAATATRKKRKRKQNETKHFKKTFLEALFVVDP